MMNNNKILTVSYGTFSCTLEGFEDSFGTMKAIAEYFRDLAADDRYFGAEPPQPDAEMLARIAEKEVARRVEARQQDGKIYLSALSAEAPSAEVSDPPASPAPAMEEPPAAEVEEPENEAIEEVAAQTEPATPEAEAEAEVAEAAPGAEITEEPQVSDDAILAAVEAASSDEEAAGDADEDMPDIVPGQPDSEVEAFFDHAGEQAETDDAAAFEDEQDSAEIDTPHAASDENSIAAKLERIRAVVSRRDEPEEEDAYLEDEHADTGDARTEGADVLSEARADIEDALDADAENDAATPANDEEEDALAALLSRVKRNDAHRQVGEDAADAGEDAEVAPAGDDVIASVEDSISGLFEDDTDSAPVQPDQPRARVIKVKRSDLEAAIAQGNLEEVDAADEDDIAAEAPQALDDIAPSKQAESTLSAVEEAELARELSALAAEADDDAEEIEEEATVEDADADVAGDEEAVSPRPAALRPGRAALPSLDEDDESGDVSRLLTETDHQMEEPEGATRRDAFAHLRAAVAARKADATIEDDAAGEEGVGAYRDDLAEVVRPRRPVPSQNRTERPEESRPAPLKLVAEQRIDVERPAPSGPVRPRRVAGLVEVETGSDGDSFADFAAEMGATTLPELLEAAAAYLSFVEGREQFSRPQLMTKVRQAGGDEGFSREEGLRHFGQLLRKGKIEKIKGGRFTASDDIGFRPDERAAG